MTSTLGHSLGRERVAIAISYLLLALAARPWGEFPLNDDWDFTVATWNFVRTGDLEFTRYTAATVKLQVLWGAVWTWLLGESHMVLRASTMALAVGTLLLIHDFLARLGAGFPARLIGPAALMVNPFFFWSSLTYMTQIPYLFLSVLAIRAFALALLGRGSAVAGGGWAIASAFVRQTGVANAVAALLATLLPSAAPRPGRGRVAAVAAAAVAVLAVLLLTTSAFISSAAELQKHSILEGPISLWRILWNGVAVESANVRNAAVGFLPLTLALSMSGLGKLTAGRATLIVLVLGALLIAPAGAIFDQEPMQPWVLLPEPTPQFGQVLTNPGLGPLTVPDVWRLRSPAPLGLGPNVRIALGFGSAVLGTILISGLVLTRWRTHQPAGGLLFAHMGVASGVLALSSFYFDRYSLDSFWALAVLLPWAVEWGDRRRLAVALAALLLLGTYSVSATAGYFSWNRARWRVAGELVGRGIPPALIDGGYEWNAMVRVWPGRPDLGSEVPTVLNAPYLIAFGPVAGHEVIARAGWSMWGVEKEMLALKRLPERADRGSPAAGAASDVEERK